MHAILTVQIVDLSFAASLGLPLFFLEVYELNDQLILTHVSGCQHGNQHLYILDRIEYGVKDVLCMFLRFISDESYKGRSLVQVVLKHLGL